MNQGLLFGIRFNAHSAKEISQFTEIEQWDTGEDCTWLHLDYTEMEVQQWITEQSGIDQIAIDALLSDASRPRVTPLTNEYLINLRGVNLNPGADPEDMVGIRIWTDGRRILSTSRRPIFAVKDVSDRFLNGSGPENVGALLVQLAEQLMSRMRETMNQIDDEIDAIEEALLQVDSDKIRSDIGAIRRTVISLKRYLAPQREALYQLETMKAHWLSIENRQALREVTDNLHRYLEGIDSVKERAIVSQEELNNRLSEKMNTRMYVLSLVTAVFLPLGFLTGLLGVNVGGLPGTDFPYAFLIFSLFLIALVGVQWWLFKRNKWL